MMKYCPSCRVEVGGTLESCPLCQNELLYHNKSIEELVASADSNEDIDFDYESENALSAVMQDPYFPDCGKLKSQSFLYKLQLFIMCAAAFICLAIDFLITYDQEIHWSLVVLAWVVGIQLLVGQLLKHHSHPSYFVFYISLYIGVLLLLTSYYLGFWKVCANILIPCLCMLAIALNFLACILDKSGIAMVYLLLDILFGIVPCIVFIAIDGMAPLFWIICMVATVVAIFALAIFVGPKVRNEIEKRLNI